MRCRVIGMWGGFPKENGPCSGYLIEEGDFSLLLDCGSGVLMEVQKYVNLNDINHVVLSHYHYDHCSDIGAYLFSRLVNTKIGRANELLQIYGPYDEEMDKAASLLKGPKNQLSQNVTKMIGNVKKLKKQLDFAHSKESTMIRKEVFDDIDKSSMGFGYLVIDCGDIGNYDIKEY